MTKTITPKELAIIVAALLTRPEAAGELDTDGKFEWFMHQIADAVSDGCGGSAVVNYDYVKDKFTCNAIVSDDGCLPSPVMNIWTYHNFDPEHQLGEKSSASPDETHRFDDVLLDAEDTDLCETKHGYFLTIPTALWRGYWRRAATIFGLGLTELTMPIPLDGISLEHDGREAPLSVFRREWAETPPQLKSAEVCVMINDALACADVHLAVYTDRAAAIITRAEPLLG